MKHKYTDTQLQAAIDGACNKINEEHKDVGGLLILDLEDNRWRNEKPARLDLIKAALAALPEPVDEESMLLNLLAVIHRDGGHYQVEHGTRKAVADACKEWQRLISIVEKTVLTEPKQSLSQLRPLAEAGDVPEGCVRYYVASADYALSLNQWSEDTHFADIQLPAAKAKCLFCEGSGFEEEDHGHYPCRSGCKPSVKAAHADKPTPEPMSTKPISLPEWTPKVGDVVMLKSGGPKMTIRAFDRDDPMEAWCHWFKEEKSCAETFPTACLQPA